MKTQPAMSLASAPVMSPAVSTNTPTATIRMAAVLEMWLTLPFADYKGPPPGASGKPFRRARSGLPCMEGHERRHVPLLAASLGNHLLSSGA